MSEQNKAIVRRLMEEVASKGHYEALDELVDAGFVGHSSTPETETRGVEGYKQFLMMLRGAFPDLQISVEDQFAEGDTVVTRWTARATHQGEFFGVPPSGRPGTMSGINIDRVSNGKVIECWSNSDELGLLRQIGALPEPAGTA